MNTLLKKLEESEGVTMKEAAVAALYLIDPISQQESDKAVQTVLDFHQQNPDEEISSDDFYDIIISDEYSPWCADEYFEEDDYNNARTESDQALQMFDYLKEVEPEDLEIFLDVTMPPTDNLNNGDFPWVYQTREALNNK